jgi:hypothetical protein
MATLEEKLAAYDREIEKRKQITQRIHDHNRIMRSNMVGAPAPSGGVIPVAPPQPGGATTANAARSAQPHERIAALTAETQLSIAVAVVDAVFGDPTAINELSFSYHKVVLK